MSHDDILWCFGGSARFADRTGSRVYIQLDEVATLGLLEDLSIAPLELLANKVYEIPDRYGSYLLHLEMRIGLVSVAKACSDESMLVSFADFVDDILSSHKQLTSAIEGLYPELVANPNYRFLVNQTEERVLRAKAQ